MHTKQVAHILKYITTDSRTISATVNWTLRPGTEDNSNQVLYASTSSHCVSNLWNLQAHNVLVTAGLQCIRKELDKGTEDRSIMIGCSSFMTLYIAYFHCLSECPQSKSSSKDEWILFSDHDHLPMRFWLAGLASLNGSILLIPYPYGYNLAEACVAQFLLHFFKGIKYEFRTVTLTALSYVDLLRDNSHWIQWDLPTGNI